MSNLKFPIEALKLTLTIISTGNPASAKGLESKANQMDGMRRAINILKDEKYKDEQRKEMVGAIVNKKYKREVKDG